MNFEVKKHEKFTAVKVNVDKLTGSVSPELKNLLTEIADEGESNIILDFTQTSFSDSSGLSAILVGNRRCKANNGTLVLCGVKDMVEKLINLSQLNNILEIVPTLAEAEDVIYMNEIETDFDNE